MTDKNPIKDQNIDEKWKELAVLSTRFGHFDATAMACRAILSATIPTICLLSIFNEQLFPFIFGIIIFVPIAITEARLRRYFEEASNRFKTIATELNGKNTYRTSVFQIEEHVSQLEWHPQGERNKIKHFISGEAIYYLITYFLCLVGSFIYVYRLS